MRSKLAQQIKRYRLKKYLTQTQAGRKIGKLQTEWSRWERGIVTPTLMNLERIAKSLNVTPNSLL